MSRTAARARWGPLGEVTGWWAAGTGAWLLTLSSMNRLDVITAMVAAVPCAALVPAARRVNAQDWRPDPSLLRWLPALVGSVLADSARLLFLVLRSLPRGRLPAGEFGEVSLPSDPEAASRATRQAVAELMLTASPGTVVVDVDEEKGRALVHFLGSGRPRLEKAVSP